MLARPAADRPLVVFARLLCLTCALAMPLATAHASDSEETSRFNSGDNDYRLAIADPDSNHMGSTTVHGKKLSTYAVSESSTATGLDLSLRETPQSITVITRQFMNDFALQSVAEVMKRTPGHHRAQTGYRTHSVFRAWVRYQQLSL